MTDPPTPERRAELRAMAAKYAGGILLSEEIIALLDAIEPVTDVEVAAALTDLRRDINGISPTDTEIKAAAMIERQARELAGLRGKAEPGGNLFIKLGALRKQHRRTMNDAADRAQRAAEEEDMAVCSAASTESARHCKAFQALSAAIAIVEGYFVKEPTP
jgi:hypothetical protein